MIGNAGTGRCIEYVPKPEDEVEDHSENGNATTYGTLTSEPCDKLNQNQYFTMSNVWNWDEAHGIVPLTWTRKCPPGLHPTIISGREASLVAYGCGIGSWLRDPIGPSFGYRFYNEKTERPHVTEADWDFVVCCNVEKFPQRKLTDLVCVTAFEEARKKDLECSDWFYE
ncbi:hypothetical protein ABW19_dt0206682 [Dactylella cylindrospora]|nr:hypothetical protein ABW19_dt0206682 [Dactylella cylindrospora]